MCLFENIAILIFIAVGLTLPNHALVFGGFRGVSMPWTILFVIKTPKTHFLGWIGVVWGIHPENPSTHFCFARRQEKKEMKQRYGKYPDHIKTRSSLHFLSQSVTTYSVISGSLIVNITYLLTYLFTLSTLMRQVRKPHLFCGVSIEQCWEFTPEAVDTETSRRVDLE